MQQSDSIDPFVLFSMRQIVGGCLDWVQEALKIVLETYLRDGNPPMNPKFDLSIFEKWDLITLINFFVTNYNEVTMHVKLEDPGLGRTLLFMIKSHRNYWAHQREFSFRDVHRLCDTIEMLFENLNDPRLNELHEKAILVRKQACLYMAKQITEEKQHGHQQAQNFNHPNESHYNVGSNQTNLNPNVNANNNIGFENITTSTLTHDYQPQPQYTNYTQGKMEFDDHSTDQSKKGGTGWQYH